MIKIITVDNNAIEPLLEILDIKNPKCSSCNISITKDNFGGIFKKKLSCNNELCIAETMGD